MRQCLLQVGSLPAELYESLVASSRISSNITPDLAANAQCSWHVRLGLLSDVYPQASLSERNESRPHGAYHQSDDVPCIKCCFTTTLLKILRSLVTILAHESSADDSMARRRKGLVRDGRRRRAAMVDDLQFTEQRSIDSSIEDD